MSIKLTFPSRLPFLFLLIFMCALAKTNLQAQNDRPNILLIIADDLGVDVSNGYHQGNLMPTTPTLDSLRSVGITFENVFAAPKCSPTRAAIMSGKYGSKNGVLGTPGNLDLNHVSIFKALADQTNNQYADALIGKWHISHPRDLNHPDQHDIDYYMGVYDSGVSDYYAWEKIENGMSSIDSSYVTTTLTNAAIDWVAAQDQPWFLWMAHVAPHSPIHLPPSHMYSLQATGTNYRKYLAMIESVDYEINRLLYSMPDSVRDNTLVIYLGDNGTPNNYTQDYPDNHGKGTVYQGGVRVPMIIAGAGVERAGEREAALVHVSDIYATILEVAGGNLPGGKYNSLSFDHLLRNEDGPTRAYNYTEISDLGMETWAIRGPQYKLIENESGEQEFYDLINDSLEFNDLLLTTLTSAQTMIKLDLEAEAMQIRNNWSCRDDIQNGVEEGIDCGGDQCAPCIVGLSNPLEAAKAISLWPNPSEGQFTIQSKEALIENIRIYNALGELLYAESGIHLHQIQLEIYGLDPQVCFVQVEMGARVETLRMVKL